MRLSMFRRPLLTLCAALILPTAACGDDSSPGSDTTDTRSDTNDTTQPDTDTAQPDTDTAQPDTDTAQPDTDTAQPDTDTTEDTDTVEDTDTTEDTDTVEDTDTTEDTDTVEDTDTTEDTDTVEDTDTTPTTSTLAELLTPFANSANNFETAPNAKVTGLVVTLVKPDVGTELGGFFVQDPADQKAIYFAPATGVAALPAELEETSVIEVTIGKIKNVSGMPMVTEYSALTITGAVESLDEAFQDATDWEIADWAGKQSTYIDMAGLLVGNPVNAGGGPNGYRRFGFISNGIEAATTDVNVRFPAEFVTYFAIEGGCEFDNIGGAVWAFRADTAGEPIQYQPMFVAPWSFLLYCTPPTLTRAQSTNSTTVVLTFSRPMYPESMDLASFTFEPPLTVLAAVVSADLKTVTLTTAEQTAASYTVTVADDAFDTTYEPINPSERSFTFATGEVATQLAVLYCFEDATGTFSAEPNITGVGFTNVLPVARVGGANQAPPSGNASKPSQCPTAGNGLSQSGSGFSTSATFDAAGAYYEFGFTAPAGRAQIALDGYRSGQGPTAFAVWTDVTNNVVGTQATVPTSPFTAYPMFPTQDELAFNIPAANTAVKVRLYPFGATGAGGTFRIDNLTVLFTPAE